VAVASPGAAAVCGGPRFTFSACCRAHPPQHAAHRHDKHLLLLSVPYTSVRCASSKGGATKAVTKGKEGRKAKADDCKPDKNKTDKEGKKKKKDTKKGTAEDKAPVVQPVPLPDVATTHQQQPQATATHPPTSPPPTSMRGVNLARGVRIAETGPVVEEEQGKVEECDSRTNDVQLSASLADGTSGHNEEEEIGMQKKRTGEAQDAGGVSGLEGEAEKRKDEGKQQQTAAVDVESSPLQNGAVPIVAVLRPSEGNYPTDAHWTNVGPGAEQSPAASFVAATPTSGAADPHSDLEQLTR
jgi:hypothetical protein